MRLAYPQARPRDGERVGPPRRRGLGRRENPSRHRATGPGPSRPTPGMRSRMPLLPPADGHAPTLPVAHHRISNGTNAEWHASGDGMRAFARGTFDRIPGLTARPGTPPAWWTTGGVRGRGCRRPRPRFGGRSGAPPSATARAAGGGAPGIASHPRRRSGGRRAGPRAGTRPGAGRGPRLEAAAEPRVRPGAGARHARGRDGQPRREHAAGETTARGRGCPTGGGHRPGRHRSRTM